jgi:hypothetical protein
LITSRFGFSMTAARMFTALPPLAAVPGGPAPEPGTF